jgi:sigma-E factor negative regulatory protein RseC
MQETGTIISIDGNNAVIQINRGEKCEGCNVCHAFGENKMRLEAVNNIGASVGDCVNVNIEPKNVIKSSMIIFVFPLLMLLVGYFIAIQFVPPYTEGTGILGALIALALSFVIIKVTDKRRNPDEMNPAIIVDFQNPSANKG